MNGTTELIIDWANVFADSLGRPLIFECTVMYRFNRQSNVSVCGRLGQW